MASPTIEWATKLAQRLAELPELIQIAAHQKDHRAVKLAEAEAEISEKALTFCMFERTDKDGAVRKVAQTSEWQYKVAVEHLRQWYYREDLESGEVTRIANEGYADALSSYTLAVNEHNKLVREWDSIDKIISLFKRAL